MYDDEKDEADTSRPGKRSRIVIFAVLVIVGLAPLSLLSASVLRKVVHGPLAFERLERIDGLLVSAEPCRPNQKNDMESAVVVGAAEGLRRIVLPCRIGNVMLARSPAQRITVYRDPSALADHETYAVDLDGAPILTYATHVTGWRGAQMRLLAIELVLTSVAIALLAWLSRNYFGEAAGRSRTR
jgi:hypothetical protein